MGSNPALAATYRDLGQVLHLQLPVALRRVNSDTVSVLGMGSGGRRGRGGRGRFVKYYILLVYVQQNMF